VCLPPSSEYVGFGRSFRRHPGGFDPRSSSPSHRVWGQRSGRVPRESLDAPEDASEQAMRQVAFSSLEDEVPRVTDEPPTGLEQPLLDARHGP